MNISGKTPRINAALAVSLIFHLAAFGVAVAIQTTAQPSAIKEYIPVDLVQLPSIPSDSVRIPVAAAPKSSEISVPVVQKERPAPAPPLVAAPKQPHSEATAAGPSQQPRTVPAPGGTTSGKEPPVAAGAVAPTSRPSTGTVQPQKRDKGSYLALQRLTRLPAFRVRAEPVYPNSERMTGSEARVLAVIYLDEHGAVDDVTIKKSGGRLFDKAVIDAARQSSFHPGYMGEKAVPTVIQIPYTFKLK